MPPSVLMLLGPKFSFSPSNSLCVKFSVLPVLFDILGGLGWLEIEVEKQTRKGYQIGVVSRWAYHINFTGKWQHRSRA